MACPAFPYGHLAAMEAVTVEQHPPGRLWAGSGPALLPLLGIQERTNDSLGQRQV